MDSKKPAKKKALGSPVNWSDDDLDKLSAISQADIKTAQALWRNEAPAPLKNMLSAKVEDNAK